MRKNLLKMTALTFVLALSLTFTGCGNKKDASTPSTNAGNTNTNSVAPETKPAETTPAETKPAETTPADTTASMTPLEEFLSDPEAQAFADQYSTDEFAVELDSVDGNILVFRFICQEQLDVTDAIVAAMDAQLDGQADLMSSQVNILASAIGADDLVIRFVYINADGTEFLTKDFK